MNLKDNLYFLLKLLSRRSVGHTTLMKEGLDNSSREFNLISYEDRHSRELVQSNPNANIINFGTKNPKYSIPLAIDNHLLYLLFERSVLTIESLEEQVKSKDISLEFNRTTIYNLKCRVDGLKSELEDSKVIALVIDKTEKGLNVISSAYRNLSGIEIREMFCKENEIDSEHFEDTYCIHYLNITI